MVIGLLIAKPYLKPFLSGQKQIPHAQIIDFAATPPIINAGGSITLSWKTENAEKVTLSTEEDSTGEDLEPVGTKIVDLRDTTVFFLKAMGRDPARKVVVAKITVTVTPEAVKPDPQIIVFETDRNVLIRGESTVLHWETDKAARIELNDNIVNPRGELEIRPDQTTTYRLIAVNESGKYNSKSITIKVDDLPRDEIAEIQDLLKMLGYNIRVADGLVGQRTQAAIEAFQNEHGLPVTGLPSRDLAEELRDVHRSVPAPEIIVFKSDRQEITRGDTLTLLWQTSNTDKVRLNPIGEVKLSGERTVRPSDTTVYELEATNRVGRSVQRTIKIHVKVPLEIESLTVDRQRIGPDAKTTIHWRTSGAERVELIPIGSVGLSGSKIVSPNETTRYELIATNDAGEKKRRSITIEIVNRPEIHLFQADSMRVKPGDYVTLSWSTRNASRVELTGIGAVEKIGNHRIRVDRSKEFKLIAANEFSERVSKTLSVETVCPPSIDEFRADRTVIFQGEFSYLHWKTSCADKVAISDLSNNVSQYGSRQVAPSLTTTYRITARGFENQVDSEKVTIFVKPTSTVKTICPPSIDEFRADRTVIFQGEFTYLHWKTSCADKVAISNLSNNVSPYGRWQVTPSLTTTYRITARNFENQMDSQKVTIYVKPP
jgi:peptidoglycan hydrolase-like protein with peptidoglycan-binding domain